jgi:hypothetical protein
MRDACAAFIHTDASGSQRVCGEGERRMYVSRLAFHTVPGRTGDVEQALGRLRDLVEAAGGGRPRILRTHYASLGAPDLVFEQEAADLAALEAQMSRVTDAPDFQTWSHEVSPMLIQSPKREVYLAV